ncbi:unnamed protein product [Phytophthora fragariaefolia]|uniref:Unnamed protein product n=1 Tax=Phytophthora fragariaefolia TaxID=1490495 RepID=A0A9W7CWV8_9STRA|nr:unnamed protein product [Phytophthora fragariaefolia]
MNRSTPASNRVIGRRLDQMTESSDWIRQFTPKAVRQALWVELSGELVSPVNTMSAVKVAEDTVSLLRAMELEPQTNPSEAALRDWPPAIAGKELKRWKRKLRLSFGTSDIGLKTPSTVRPKGDADPSQIPLPQTPTIRTEDAEYDDPTDELARQVREVSEMERLNSTPGLELATHRPLAQIKAFSGLSSLSEMMAELQVRESKYGRSERSKSRDMRRSLEDSSTEDVEDRSTDDDQSGSDYADPYHSDEHDRHVATANDAERRTEAIGTYGRSENRGRRGDFPNRGIDRNSRHQGPDRRSRQEDATEVKTMEIEKERHGSFGGGESSERRNGEWNGGSSEGLVSSVTRKTCHNYQPENVIKLFSGERLGWWSAQKFDNRVRMRALVQGAVNDARTRILLDTGANVSVISEHFAEQLRLREVRDHGRRMEIQGFTKGTMATTKRALAKVTLGWNQVYEYELWVMDHGAGVNVVLGTEFMIPAGVRRGLFHATAQLPDEVEIPLVKTQLMADTREEGPHVPDGPTEVLTIPGHASRDYRPMRQPPTNETHELWVRRTKEFIPKVVEFRRGRPRRVRVTNISDRLVTCPVHLPLLLWVPRGDLPRTEGYLGLGSDKYNEWRVLAYSRSTDSDLYKAEGEIYKRWLAAQPSAVETVPYTTPTKILRQPSESSEGSMSDRRDHAECAAATTEPSTEMVAEVVHQEEACSKLTAHYDRVSEVRK